MRPMHNEPIIVAVRHEYSSREDPARAGEVRDIAGHPPWAAVLAPRLAQFAAVARHEHVTRAAQELGMPQSTLSRAVVRLEADLGVALFARHGRTVSLTPAGRLFHRSVERALDGVERAAEEVRADADPATGRVAFGFMHTLGAEAVPGLLREFRADHPGVRFQLVQNYGEAMHGETARGRTRPVPDLAAPGRARPGGAPARRAAAASGGARGTTGWPPAAGCGSPTPPTSAFVTLEAGYGLRRITDALCAEAGFTPKVAFEGEEAETLRGLVAAGLGVALLPPPSFPRPGVAELAVTARHAAREIGVTWLAGHPATAPVTAFKDFVLSRKGRLLPR